MRYLKPMAKGTKKIPEDAKQEYNQHINNPTQQKGTGL